MRQLKISFTRKAHVIYDKNSIAEHWERKGFQYMLQRQLDVDTEEYYNRPYLILKYHKVQPDSRSKCETKLAYLLDNNIRKDSLSWGKNY